MKTLLNVFSYSQLISIYLILWGIQIVCLYFILNWAVLLLSFKTSLHILDNGPLLDVVSLSFSQSVACLHSPDISFVEQKF
jgi:hypothetical protein